MNLCRQEIYFLPGSKTRARIELERGWIENVLGPQFVRSVEERGIGKATTYIRAHLPCWARIREGATPWTHKVHRIQTYTHLHSMKQGPIDKQILCFVSSSFRKLVEHCDTIDLSMTTSPEGEITVNVSFIRYA